MHIIYIHTHTEYWLIGLRASAFRLKTLHGLTILNSYHSRHFGINIHVNTNRSLPGLPKQQNTVNQGANFTTLQGIFLRSMVLESLVTGRFHKNEKNLGDHIMRIILKVLRNSIVYLLEGTISNMRVLDGDYGIPLQVALALFLISFHIPHCKP